MKETIKSAAQWFAAELARQFAKAEIAHTADLYLAKSQASRTFQAAEVSRQIVGIAVGMGFDVPPPRVWGEVREMTPEQEVRFAVVNPHPGKAFVTGVEFTGRDLVLVGTYVGHVQIQEGGAPITPLVLQAFCNTKVERGDTITFCVQWRPNK